MDHEVQAVHIREEVFDAGECSAALTDGRWYSEYDGAVVPAASALDIDHIVPLTESWDSGASAWTPARREAYANDLTSPAR
jgi:hypothetical protein